MPFFILLFAAPFLVIAVHKLDAESITEQDQLNRSLLIIVYLIWLVFSDDLPADQEVFVSLSMMAACCLVWFVFWLIPWLEWALLLLVALVSGIALLGPSSSLGQLLAFVGSSLVALMMLGLQQARDSTAARYHRANWVQPSPLERKVRKDLVSQKPINRQ